MKFKIQLILEDEQGKTNIEDIIQLEKSVSQGYSAGLTLQESKELLKTLQQKMVLHQAKNYTNSHKNCPYCNKLRRIKGQYLIQFRTLFGIVVIPNLRLYQCKCHTNKNKTCNVLDNWLPEHVNPELQYIESKWASYMSFNTDSRSNLNDIKIC